ncbi:MAG: LicD family protein [Clostridiales bacterium]|nr:LicD family protein [Clostridiales bacterium]
MKMSDVMGLLDSSKHGFCEVGDEELKKIHALLADMLQDLYVVCKKHDIKWLLTGGSALGAVRHQGFIPWDDDVDINMTRDNFNKFAAIFQEELGEKYVLGIPGDDQFPHPYPKIFKKGTKFKGIHSSDYGETGFFIDIFILENTHDNRFARFIHGLKCTFYAGVVSAVRTRRFKDDYLRVTEDNRRARRTVKFRAFIGKFFWYKSLEGWVKSADKCFSKVKKPDSKYVVMPSGIKHFFGELYLRDKMCNTKEAAFENYSFPIPEDCDYYLTVRYGDYMTIPPVEQRRHHAVMELDFGEEKEEYEC